MYFYFFISGVHPHGCTLSWKKPLDDGGSPLTAYVIEKKDFDKDIWISCGNLRPLLVNSSKNYKVFLISKIVVNI